MDPSAWGPYSSFIWVNIVNRRTIQIFKISVRKESLQQFHWTGLFITFSWFLSQNILVEMIVYSTQVAKDKDLSWAPLSPLGPWVNPTIFRIGSATCTLQAQAPWLIMTPVFYFLLLWQQSRFSQGQQFV